MKKESDEIEDLKYARYKICEAIKDQIEYLPPDVSMLRDAVNDLEGICRNIQRLRNVNCKHEQFQTMKVYGPQFTKLRCKGCKSIFIRDDNLKKYTMYFPAMEANLKEYENTVKTVAMVQEQEERVQNEKRKKSGIILPPRFGK